MTHKCTLVRKWVREPNHWACCGTGASDDEEEDDDKDSELDGSASQSSASLRPLKADVLKKIDKVSSGKGARVTDWLRQATSELEPAARRDNAMSDSEDVDPRPPMNHASIDGPGLPKVRQRGLSAGKEVVGCCDQHAVCIHGGRLISVNIPNKLLKCAYLCYPA